MEGLLLLTKQEGGGGIFFCLISVAIAIPMAGFQAFLQARTLKYY